MRGDFACLARAPLVAVMKKISRLSRVTFYRLAVLALVTPLWTACGGSKPAEVQRRAPNAANEAAAVRSLQTIFRAQTQYMTLHPGYYGTFDELVRDGTLDQRFSGDAPVLEGYVFRMALAPGGGGQAPTYSVNADPADAATQGARHLYMDSSSNVIRANASRPATANDPPIQ